ncbi:DUF2270 domain-containing protein [Roseomonas chloroacetimidivorans]|uniref:DUF2270 domain-containing protein n=1 Tax=Roseomonas chloroacetimidivorans TaxID=1766656 RepID=UPI003C745D38
MDTVGGKQADDERPGRSAAVPIPASTGEAITVLAHFHRAEIGRMTGWRDRIDLTTNWAITVVAGMLSVSLSTPAAHHGVLLFAMVLVMLLLSIEARRYRFFDVYRTRVRRLERNYYAQIFAPRPGRTDDWVRDLGEDLREPKFLMSRRAAISRRLRRNYFWMFLVLLAAWILKISSSWLLRDEVAVDPAKPVPGIIQNVALGPVPGWAVLIAVGVFYCWLCYATFRPREKGGELAHGEVHV